MPAQKTRPSVKPGKNTFSLSMPIEPAYPNIKVVGKFTLSGNTSNKMCFMLPLKIMPAQKTQPKIETPFDPRPNRKINRQNNEEKQKLPLTRDQTEKLIAKTTR